MKFFKIIFLSSLIFINLNSAEINLNSFDEIITVIRTCQYNSSGELLEKPNFLYVKYRIKQYIINGGNINQCTNDGSTMLIIASKLNFLDLVDFLIDQEGIDLNISDNFQTSAIKYAATFGYWQIVSSLINANAKEFGVKDIVIKQFNDKKISTGCFEEIMSKLKNTEKNKI